MIRAVTYIVTAVIASNVADLVRAANPGEHRLQMIEVLREAMYTQKEWVRTWVGAIVGILVIVPILYWNEITGSPGISFIWSMPLCLAAQISACMLASLLPFGTAAPLHSTINPEAEDSLQPRASESM